MAPENTSVQAAAQQGTTKQGGGGLFTALRTASALSDVFGGVSGLIASGNEARDLEKQALELEREAQVRAEQRAGQISKFQQKQASRFLSSGVTLQGTPVVVLEETRQKGQEEVDALIRAGQSRANLARSQSRQARGTGRAFLTQGLFGASGRFGDAFFLGRRLGIFKNTAGNPGATQPQLSNPQVSMRFNPITGDFDILNPGNTAIG